MLINILATRPAQLHSRRYHLVSRFAAWPAAVVAIFLCVLSTLASGADSMVQVLTEAEIVLSDSTTPPPESAAWKPQALPDYWSDSRPDITGKAWYRLRFELPQQPSETQALYLPRVRWPRVVYVNGQSIGTPLHNRQIMRLFEIPAGLLAAGSNTILVGTEVAAGESGVMAFAKVGPEAQLRRWYETRLLVEYTGALGVCIFSVAFGAFALMLWLRRRRDTIYAFLGLCGVFYAGWLLGYVQSIRYDVFLLLTNPIGNGANVAALLFSLRYAGWRWPRIEAVVIAAWLLTPLMGYAALSGHGGWLAAHWLDQWILTEFLYSGVFAAVAWRRRTVDSILLALVAPLCELYSLLYPYLHPTPDSLDIFAYVWVPLYVAMGLVLLDRFAKSLSEAEQLNVNLEQRVAQKHAELQENFQRLQALEREQAIAEERSRIMSDMHDGIGAQLISTLGLAEHGQLSAEEMATALRECLDDLRLTIDSLEPVDNDLLLVLGNFRYRVDPRLQKQGIALDWQVTDIPKLACLTPRNLLHLLRLLQEAFTNVLKHAHASLIRVETGTHADGRHVFIRVRDNGGGFSGEHRGHGLDNMTERARRIGGLLQIEPTASGTTLELLLPVT